MFLFVSGLRRLAIQCFVEAQDKAINLPLFINNLTIDLKLSYVGVFVVFLDCPEMVSSDLFSLFYMLYSRPKDNALSFFF